MNIEDITIMNDRNKIKDLFAILQEEMDWLIRAADVLNYSYETCSKIGIKEEFTYEELDKFESFTVRFARVSDLLIEKIFRRLAAVDQESSGTVREHIHRAEQKKLIANADVFFAIRIVRNQVAHEYIQHEIHELFIKVLEYTPTLLDSVQRVKNYCRQYGYHITTPSFSHSIEKITASTSL
jgi:hypothetical protein